MEIRARSQGVNYLVVIVDDDCDDDAVEAAPGAAYHSKVENATEQNGNRKRRLRAARMYPT